MCFFCFFILAETDYYKILNVNRNADNKELKRAYLRLSKKWHPDKNGGDEKMFREIAHAYQVLSNPEKRKIYDMHGEEGLRAQDEYGSQEYQDPFDIFSKIFENNFRGTKRGPNMEKVVEMELEELYYGGIYTIEVDKQIICYNCQGSGRDPKHKHSVALCDYCNGHGIRIIRQMIAPGVIQTYQIVCDICHGQGQVVLHPCPICRGKKIIEDSERYTLNVPAGAPYGYQFIFQNEANESPEWEAGDLYITIAEKPYSKSGWRRKNNDLYRVETISLPDALLGKWNRRIKLFGNEYLNIIKPEGYTIQTGYVDIFPEKGMPVWDSSHHTSSANRGNVYIEWKVILPELKLNDPLRKKIAKIFNK